MAPEWKPRGVLLRAIWKQWGQAQALPASLSYFSLPLSPLPTPHLIPSLSFSLGFLLAGMAGWPFSRLYYTYRMLSIIPEISGETGQPHMPPGCSQDWAEGQLCPSKLTLPHTVFPQYPWEGDSMARVATKIHRCSSSLYKKEKKKKKCGPSIVSILLWQIGRVTAVHCVLTDHIKSRLVMFKFLCWGKLPFV